MFGITAILGSWHVVSAILDHCVTDLRTRGGGTLGQSDWTRYANRPYAPTLSQLFAAYVIPMPLHSVFANSDLRRPVTIIVCATIGVIVTSCAQQILGELIWEPFQLLGALQEY